MGPEEMEYKANHKVMCFLEQQATAKRTKEKSQKATEKQGSTVAGGAAAFRESFQSKYIRDCDAHTLLATITSEPEATELLSQFNDRRSVLSSGDVWQKMMNDRTIASLENTEENGQLPLQ